MTGLETLVMNVLTISLTCSVVLLPLLVLTPRIRRRVAARSFHVLFLLLALRLLVPVRLTLPQPAVTVEAPEYTITLPVRMGTEEDQSAPSAPMDSNQTQPTEMAQSSGSVGQEIFFTEILGVVWLTGVGVCLLWGMGFYFLARRRLLHGARPAESSAQSRLEKLAGEKGLKRVPGLVRAPAASGPLMLGLFRPSIILPQRGYDEEELTFVLLHELTHLRRGDVLYKAVLSLACAVHWFNPLVWLMSRTAGRNLELCCDDAVVRGLDQPERCRYGTMLLDAAERARPLALSTRFGGGRGLLRERLTNLFAEKKGSKILVCAALGAALLVGGLVACESGGVDEERRELLRAYLDKNFQTGLCSVTLADLTGDGAEEMIVIELSDQDGELLAPQAEELDRFSYGSVDVYGLMDGQVTLLYEQPCATAHAGWGYNYLCPNADGGPALLTFAPYVGQGFASYSYTLFRFDEDGNQVMLDSDSVEFIVDAANPVGGGMEQASRTEVEDFLARVEGYRADAVPLLVYNEPYDSSMGSPDHCWLAASEDDAFGESVGNYLGRVVGQDGQVVFALPEASPETPEEALDALERAVQFYGEGYVFRLPAYDGAWTIQVAGRMAMDGENYMSVHYLQEVTEWVPGDTYSFETGDGHYSELILWAQVTGPDGTTAERTIPLIEEDYASGGEALDESVDEEAGAPGDAVVDENIEPEADGAESGETLGAVGPEYDVNWRLLINFLMGFENALFSCDQERAASLMADPAGVSFPEEDISDRVQETSTSLNFEGEHIIAVCEYLLEGEDAPRTLTMTVEDKWASGVGEGYAILAFEWTD